MPPLEMNFEREEILGRGSFSTVYNGIWNGQHVAVKRILILKAAGAAEEVMRKQNHPNIIKLLHTEIDEDFKYFILELCAASIDKVFLPDDDARKYRGPLPSDEDVLLGLSKGLKYIHSQKLAHCDIKPCNVLVSICEPVMVKWSDFGLTRSSDEREPYTLSQTRGTLLWRAPEMQLTNKISEANPRRMIKSDVWSAGCLFFYYLTKGLHPYGKQRDFSDTYCNISNDNPVEFELIRCHPAAQVIRQMLHFDVDKRIEMSDVILSLQEVFHGRNYEVNQAVLKP